MIRTREEAVARFKRTEHRFEAAAWLAKSIGFTSRDAVLCSLVKKPGSNVSWGFQQTNADGLNTMIWLIGDDILATAVIIHAERCGAPTFPSTEAQDDYVKVLEKALQAGMTPVPARAAALRAVNYAPPKIKL